MAKVVVVFHSGYGHTVKQAEAIAKGANAELLQIDAKEIYLMTIGKQ